MGCKDSSSEGGRRPARAQMGGGTDAASEEPWHMGTNDFPTHRHRDALLSQAGGTWDLSFPEVWKEGTLCSASGPRLGTPKATSTWAGAGCPWSPGGEYTISGDAKKKGPEGWPTLRNQGENPSRVPVTAVWPPGSGEMADFHHLPGLAAKLP